jgi:cyclase
MDRDGTGKGYDLELTAMAAKAVRVPVIASGGVGTLEHMEQGLKAGAGAVLAAGIFHFGQFTVRQAKEFLRGKGVAVRPTM